MILRRNEKIESEKELKKLAEKIEKLNQTAEENWDIDDDFAEKCSFEAQDICEDIYKKNKKIDILDSVINRFSNHLLNQEEIISALITEDRIFGVMMRVNKKNLDEIIYHINDFESYFDDDDYNWTEDSVQSVSDLKAFVKDVIGENGKNYYYETLNEDFYFNGIYKGWYIDIIMH